VSGFLLDTNISSELTKPIPDVRVTSWVGAQDNASLYLSVVSVGEVLCFPEANGERGWNSGLNTTSFRCLPAESCR
jgi:predicted nucleic acid-binding protein